MISALISGGSSLLGGLLGNRSKRKQAKKQHRYNIEAAKLQHSLNQQAARQQYALDNQARQQQFQFDVKREKRQQEIIKNTEQERFKWLVQGAQNAGFNPLTVLGATGGGMGQSPSAAGEVAANQQVVAEQVATQQAPLSNIGATIANAGEAFARFLPDPIEQQTQRLQNELLKKQIAGIDNENRRFGVPSVVRSDSPVKLQSTPPITTAFGDIVPWKDVREEAGDIRTREEGMKGAYDGVAGMWPSWLPTGEHIEGLAGDLWGNVYSAIAAPVAVGTWMGERARQSRNAGRQKRGYSPYTKGSRGYNTYMGYN